MKIAIIGGGIAGLTAAAKLSARPAVKITLFEAAPLLGGRTRSFIHKPTNEWCDNGPHLLIGAYRATQQLLALAGAGDNITWQPSLHLPLWEKERGQFSLNSSPWLPFSASLLAAIGAMPGHGSASVTAMLRLALAMRGKPKGTVAQWFTSLSLPAPLVRDMLRPLCLAIMNEEPETTDAHTFARVLLEAFASRQSARLGWFNKPLQQAIIEPVAGLLNAHGVNIQTAAPVRALRCAPEAIYLTPRDGKEMKFDKVVLAIPAHARNQLLGITTPIETRAICNVHLWCAGGPALRQPLVGGIGTHGEWFFDVSQQFFQRSPLRHYCAVISADSSEINSDARVASVKSELEQVVGKSLVVAHSKIIREEHATVLVRPTPIPPLDPRLIDACEAPQPGELPATIEAAARRGFKAADMS